MKEKNAKKQYAEQSPFVRVLGTPGRVKVLDVFLRKPKTELSTTDISELAGVNPSTFSRNKEVLINLDLISKTKSEGNKNYYRLNSDQEINKILAQAQTELFRHAKYVSERTQIKETDHIGKIAITEAKNQSDGDSDEEMPNTPINPQNLS